MPEYPVGLPNVAVDVRQEDRGELHRRHRDLRQAHAGATAGIELKQDGSAAIALVTVTHQRPRTGLAVKNGGPALRSG